MAPTKVLFLVLLCCLCRVDCIPSPVAFPGPMPEPQPKALPDPMAQSGDDEERKPIEETEKCGKFDYEEWLGEQVRFGDLDLYI